MKSSEILREAARLVESRSGAPFGCVAIAHVLGLYDGPCGPGVSGIPEKVMARFEVVSNGYRFGPWWDESDSGPRIIGLCLAAAIAEDAGD